MIYIIAVLFVVLWIVLSTISAAIVSWYCGDEKLWEMDTEEFMITLMFSIVTMPLLLLLIIVAFVFYWYLMLLKKIANYFKWG